MSGEVSQLVPTGFVFSGVEKKIKVGTTLDPAGLVFLSIQETIRLDGSYLQHLSAHMTVGEALRLGQDLIAAAERASLDLIINDSKEN